MRLRNSEEFSNLNHLVQRGPPQQNSINGTFAGAQELRFEKGFVIGEIISIKRTCIRVNVNS